MFNTPRIVYSLTVTAELRFQSGRDIAQAVSRRLTTAVARDRDQVTLCGICGRQSGPGAGFLSVFRFPLPILIPPTAQNSLSSIIRCCYNIPISGDVPSGLSLTTPQKSKKKKDSSQPKNT
jgi:hypothetical protein